MANSGSKNSLFWGLRSLPATFSTSAKCGLNFRKFAIALKKYFGGPNTLPSEGPPEGKGLQSAPSRALGRYRASVSFGRILRTSKKPQEAGFHPGQHVFKKRIYRIAYSICIETEEVCGPQFRTAPLFEEKDNHYCVGRSSELRHFLKPRFRPRIWA